MEAESVPQWLGHDNPARPVNGNAHGKMAIQNAMMASWRLDIRPHGMRKSTITMR
jgi:hypothetical protein